MNAPYIAKSKSNVHITPDVVFQDIRKIWGYTRNQLFDPCPVKRKFNGLDIPWHKVNIVNPPYDQLTEFVVKAFLEKLRGKKSIMLLPSKTDQMWFHNFILEYGFDIHWIRGRLTFKNDQWGSPQPHFLVMIA